MMSQIIEERWILVIRLKKKKNVGEGETNNHIEDTRNSIATLAS